MTKVICTLQRKGGTKVFDMFGKDYHFKPESGDGLNPEIPHVCDIPDSEAEALYRFLSITTSYQLEDPNAKLPPRPRKAVGDSNLIGNEKPPVGAAARPVIITNEDGDEINLTAMSPEELRIFAKDKMDIKVHHKWSDLVVIQKIVEKTRNEG